MHAITSDGKEAMSMKGAGWAWWEKMEGRNFVIKIQS